MQKLHLSHSFFLFGARGTGKTTLLKKLMPRRGTLWIDLLTEEDEERFIRNPDKLMQILDGRPYSRVVVDEVQKVPKLLDVIHKCIEEKKGIQFVMTGSSARKLKRGHANLLAGRAFVYHLHPFSHLELGRKFSLEQALNFGTLPGVFEYKDDGEKVRFLKSYARTYLREEIQMEQIARKVERFRNFLEVAAQSSGQIVNYSKIANDVGVDDKTVAQYIQIVEDTLIGMTLPARHQSLRKQQIISPKFYLFDPGVTRILERGFDRPIVPETFAWGRAFEQFVILECHRLNDYFETDYRFSYYKDKDGREADLIIDRGRDGELVVEIKSAHTIDKGRIKALENICKIWDKPAEFQIWSCDEKKHVFGKISCLPWQEGLAGIWGEKSLA